MNAYVDLTSVVLEIDRLIIRAWKETDLEDFYECTESFTEERLQKILKWIHGEN